MSNSHRDKTLKGIFRKYGLEGEARFWRLVELMAEAFENDCTSFDFELENLRECLRFRSLKDCRSFLDTLTILTEMKVEYIENDCRIIWSKLLDIKDNHSSNLQVAKKRLPRDLALELELEKERELEEELKNKVVDTDSEFNLGNIAVIPDSRIPIDERIFISAKSFTEKATEIQEGLSSASKKRVANQKEPWLNHGFDLVKLYEKYPRKEGRKDGLTRLIKIVTTEEKYSQVMSAIDNYTHMTAGTETKFIKLFSSFVSNWEDYLVISGNSVTSKNTSVADHARKLLENNPFQKGGLNGKSN